jgi:hypothetical protein
MQRKQARDDNKTAIEGESESTGKDCGKYRASVFSPVKDALQAFKKNLSPTKSGPRTREGKQQKFSSGGLNLSAEEVLSLCCEELGVASD